MPNLLATEFLEGDGVVGVSVELLVEMEWVHLAELSEGSDLVSELDLVFFLDLGCGLSEWDLSWSCFQWLQSMACASNFILARVGGLPY